MALITTIREKMGWLLIVMIALGLGGFILMDMFSGQSSLFGSNSLMVGKVNGRNIDINEFNRTESILYSNATGDPYARRSTLWNYFVEETIIEGEAKALGLGVSKDELIELQFGQRLSPIIQQRFSDPNTRQVDINRLGELRKQITENTMDPFVRSYWAIQEKEIIKEAIQSKMVNMVTKGMYTPKWMAEAISKDQSTTADFLYVQIPFAEIEDNKVSLTDADYQAYLDENAMRFKTDKETRKVAYVSFDIKPSSGDSATFRKEIQDLVPSFASAENDSLFVTNNYGTINGAYTKKSALSPAVADSIVRLSVGSVFGPYLEGREYKAAKLLGVKTVADSIEARHILLQADVQNPGSIAAAMAKADSIKNEITAGSGTFADFALAFSQDASNKEKGGSLDYFAEGRMVPEFNDLVFYTAKKGELNKVVTQFGVHLVEVTGQKFTSNESSYRVAYITRAIEPSDATITSVEDKATAIMQDNRSLEALKAAIAKDPSLEVITTNGLDENEFTVAALGGGNSSRDMVKWAFSSKKGDVAPDLYLYTDPVGNYVNKYVIASLASVRPAGKARVEDVKEEIMPLVMNKKKTDFVSSAAANKDMNTIAQLFASKVDTASNASLGNAFVPNLGPESKVIGTVFGTAQNKVSKAIQGNNGIYVIMPLVKREGTVGDVMAAKAQASNSAKGSIPSTLMASLIKNASIKDSRSSFF